MAEEQVSQPVPSPPAPVEQPSAEPAIVPKSWLRENRLKVALGIAIAEVFLVALEEDFSRWTVILLAVPVILFWALAGRTLDRL